MASYFFDTSGLVKRYVEEKGSDWVRSICDADSTEVIFVADITEVELASAFFRKVKGGLLTIYEAESALGQFDIDKLHQYVVSGVNYDLIKVARGLIEKHSLRAYDAIQLAIAIECNIEQTFLELPRISFITADRELLQAAQSEGISTSNPNDYA